MPDCSQCGRQAVHVAMGREYCCGCFGCTEDHEADEARRQAVAEELQAMVDQDHVEEDVDIIQVIRHRQAVKVAQLQDRRPPRDSCREGLHQFETLHLASQCGHCGRTVQEILNRHAADTPGRLLARWVRLAWYWLVGLFLSLYVVLWFGPASYANAMKMMLETTIILDQQHAQEAA